MALKNYRRDYPEPKIPPVRDRQFEIDPKEWIEINYFDQAIKQRNQAILTASGDLVQVWRQKQIGTRCTNPNCPAYENYQQSGSPDCPVCLGTGFVGGYDYIEEILVRFPPEMEIIEIEQQGLARMVKPKIWTMPDPTLYQFDILINFSQPQLMQQKTVFDIEVTRGATSFDSIGITTDEYTQIIRIIKISDSPNSSPDYKADIDFVLSNNGVLWKTDNQPDLGAVYFVSYQVTERYYRRYEINQVRPSRLRGTTLHQYLEVTELNISHPSYKISQNPLTADEQEILTYPFPTSEWFDRE